MQKTVKENERNGGKINDEKFLSVKFLQYSNNREVLIVEYLP